LYSDLLYPRTPRRFNSWNSVDRSFIVLQRASWSLPKDSYEYKRLGTVSLLAGLDLHRGTVTEIVSETHKSKDFKGVFGPLSQMESQ
jgi:hypothetical protein